MNIRGKHYIYRGEIYKTDQTILNKTITKGEVYEVLRVEDGITLFLDDHLKRLQSGFLKLKLPPSFTNKEITHAIHKLIYTDQIKNENIKISCFLNPDTIWEYYIYTIPTSYPSELMYKQGVSAALLNAERTDPNIKIANTKVRSMANSQIEKQHTFEALLINHDGLITEGSRTNVFFILNDIIYTAPSELVLEGIIRSKVLDILQKRGYHLKMQCIHTSQISLINAAFVTGTSLRILPLNKIENQTITPQHPFIMDLMNFLAEEIMDYKTKNAGTS